MSQTISPHNNKLLSPFGFSFIFDRLVGCSEPRELQNILSDLHDQAPDLPVLNHKDKSAQIAGLIHLIQDSYGHITDIGCSKGYLTAELSKHDPHADIVGVDRENIPKVHGNETTRFVHQDAFTFVPRTGLVVALHACGSLTDRVLEMAAHSESDVVCVPCCFGKIQTTTPRSRSLRRYEEDYRYAQKMARAVEGVNQTDGLGALQRDLWRSLVNLDRLMYLQEQGYEIGYSAITAAAHSGYAQSSLRFALRGKLNS